MCASFSVCKIAVAKNRKLLAARGMSRERASESGLPVSIDSARASFSKSRSIRSAMRKRIFDRSAAGDLGIRLSCGGLDVVEKASALRFNKLTANEVLDSGEILGHRTALSFTDNSKRCLDFARHDKEVGSTNSPSMKFLI